MFAGEIIEKARTVQAEWAVAYDQTAFAAFEAENAAAAAAAAAAASGTRVSNSSNGTPKDEEDNGSGPPKSTSTSPATLVREQTSAAVTTMPRPDFKPPPNPHRGQLLPSHLREALRRYKRDAEGRGVGFSGLSMGNLGIRGAFTWNSGSVGGKRLFR